MLLAIFIVPHWDDINYPDLAIKCGATGAHTERRHDGKLDFRVVGTEAAIDTLAANLDFGPEITIVF